MFRSLRTQPLHAAIQHQLKQYILDRGLRPGDQLPTEEQISREIGASRNAVREALRALESLGLIEVRHGDGRFVREFNFDAFLDNLTYAIYFNQRTFEELTEVRGELEIAFINRALSTLDDSDTTALRDLVSRMRNRASTGQSFLTEDQELHRRIFQKIGNQLLLQVLDVFWSVTAALQSSHEFAAPPSSATRDVCDQHEQLVEALARRDEQAAYAAIQYHFDFFLAHFRSRMSERQPSTD